MKMSVPTDPEVVEQIRQDHAALRRKAHRIHTVLAQPEPTPGEIEKLLREFLSALVVHFAHEEEEGFFDEVVARAPRLAGPAGDLCNEHKELVRKADELCRFAAAGSPSVVWWRELNIRCREFNRELMYHEREENSLLQRAHQRDLGRSD
jgi:iron-sulfur cluster repair protein YtfE (RIC family)